MPKEKENSKSKDSNSKNTHHKDDVYRELNEISFKLSLEYLDTFYITSNEQNKEEKAA